MTRALWLASDDFLDSKPRKKPLLQINSIYLNEQVQVLRQMLLQRCEWSYAFACGDVLHTISTWRGCVWTFKNRTCSKKNSDDRAMFVGTGVICDASSSGSQ
jgi:hypothetical protein